MFSYVKVLAAAIVCTTLVAVQGYDMNEQHKARLEQAATRERVDVEIGVMRELVATVNPKAQHLICKGKDGRSETDLGIPHECADGRCVTWKGAELNLEAAGARCDRGTL